MAANLLERLVLLDGKIGSLRTRIKELEDRIEALETENADLRRDKAQADTDRDKAVLDAKFLAVSHKLADSPDNLVVARRQIAALIRNIDRCLEMLKE